MFTVYVLYAADYQKIYIGYTSNLEERLKSHNHLGKKGYTTKYRPWRVAGLIGVETADINLDNYEQPIYFQVIYEVFSTFDKGAFELFVNQSRYHLAIGHRISKKFRYELHYIRQGKVVQYRRHTDFTKYL